MLTLFLDVLFVAVIVLLVWIASVVISPTALSKFELERRTRGGDKLAENELNRKNLMPDIISLQRITESILLVVAASLGMVLWGLFAGSLVAVAVALFYRAFARLPLIHQIAQRIYGRQESSVNEFVRRYGKLIRLLQSRLPLEIESGLNSREELVHLIESSGGVLSSDEKQRILHGLTFHDRKVSEVMTPRAVIESIKSSELLGPLVLDELHKTGHSRFPVIRDDIDHVVGMLHVRDLLIVDGSKKHTMRVETAMEPKVFYIRDDQTLAHALAAFLKTRHHLFVVINESRETVGLLSLEDVIEALLGHPIVDEFDAHDDLRAVAARNPHGNNRPSGAKDV